MLVSPPPWSVRPARWWAALAWSGGLALSETAVGLWLRELSGSLVARRLPVWLAALTVLLALRVFFLWRREMAAENLALADGQAFQARAWRRPASLSNDAWTAREGRERVEQGTRASLQVAGSLLTLTLLLPALVWTAPLLSGTLLILAPLLARTGRARSRRARRRARLENMLSSREARDETWAARALPEARASRLGGLVARTRRLAQKRLAIRRSAWNTARIGEQAQAEALAHLAGLGLSALALWNWSRGAMEVPDLLAFLGLSLLAYRPVREAGRALPALQRARPAWMAVEAARPATGCPPPGAVLEARGLGLRHAPRGPWVVRGLDLRLAPGDIAVVRSPNGGGKSTLLAALAGAIPVSEGILVRPRRIAWLAQEPVLPPVSPAAWSGLPDPPGPQALGGLCGKLFPEGLPPNLRWDAPIPEGGSRLSRGERARLALLCLAARPADLWLLDEPLSALPPERRAELLPALFAARGQAAILVAEPVDTTFATGTTGPRVERLEPPS